MEDQSALNEIIQHYNTDATRYISFEKEKKMVIK